jgi:hypothetical protein
VAAYSGRREFRTPRSTVAAVVVAALLFLAGAIFMLSTRGLANLWTVAFIGLSVAGILAIIEAAVRRIVLDDESLHVKELWGRRRYARADVVGVEQRKGVPAALQLTDGRWAKLPEVDGHIGNSVRAWVKADR